MLAKITSALIIFFLCPVLMLAQDDTFSIRFRSDVTITFDRPAAINKKKSTQVIFYALPNGNTTAQTMGKITGPSDDWHFDIQHIRAQTAFIRHEYKNENIIVVYLENDMKAWPAWKRSRPDHRSQILSIIDTTIKILGLKNYTMHLNGHSGGGSFIFGFLDGIKKIPDNIERISFIDSNYGYDSSYAPKIIEWLQHKDTYLTVFAYNDSVALFNGKPVVSATGGTWYRSKLMMKQMADLAFLCKGDTLQHCRSGNGKMNIYLKDNPERKIFHTQQVELNGFIHSVLIGTSKENKGYTYFGERAYEHLIR